MCENGIRIQCFRDMLFCEMLDAVSILTWQITRLDLHIVTLKDSSKASCTVRSCYCKYLADFNIVLLLIFFLVYQLYYRNCMPQWAGEVTMKSDQWGIYSLHWTLQSGGLHSFFIFRRFKSGPWLNWRNLPQSLQPDARIIPHIRPWSATSVHIHSNLIFVHH
jgi:hypothetical protein